MTERDLCPIDLLVLSVYQAKYLHPQCVGPAFPAFRTIEPQFDLLQHTKPIETNDGVWTITLWQRKSLRELQQINAVARAAGSEENLKAYLLEEQRK